MALSHMAAQIGRVLGGRYRILSPLGSGMSAEVYLGDDVRLHRRVVIKLLHPALADDQPFLRRFRAEVRAAAALSHPNILAVYDWNGDGQPYLVTEYLKGGSLRSILDAGKRLNPSQALVVGLQAATALDVAHRQGFVHRNIKPANLLFGGDGRLRVADFGVARAVADAAVTEPGDAVLGTARYASPEQARGESLTGLSDVYSLALVLIEAVTGKVPFAADTTFATLTARLERPVPVPEAMAALQPVLERAGTVVPDRRPDAAELVAALMDAAGELPRPGPLPLVGAAPMQGGGDEGGSGDRTMVVPAVPPPTPGPPEPAPPTASPPGPAAPAPALPAFPVSAAAPAPPGPDTLPVPATPFAEDPNGGPAHLAVDEYDDTDPSLSGRTSRKQTPSWVIPTLLVALALVVGAGGVWFLREASVPTHVVPESLIGADISELNNLIGDRGWRISQTEVHEEDSEAGQILRTDPAPGTELREGEGLEVVVSLGPPLVDLPPNLPGLHVDEATDRLEDRGFEWEVEREQHETVARDHVVEVAEGTEEMLPEGATVVLVVSDGPPLPSVPDVAGMTWDDARQELAEAGLGAAQRRERDRDVERGQVIRTDPEVGTEVEPGTEVTVYVSQDRRRDGGGGGDDGDDMVRVPALFMSRLEDAIEQIEDAGLEVGQIHGNNDRRATVTGQSPRGLTMAEPGTEVDLWTF